MLYILRDNNVYSIDRDSYFIGFRLSQSQPQTGTASAEAFNFHPQEFPGIGVQDVFYLISRGIGYGNHLPPLYLFILNLSATYL